MLFVLGDLYGSNPLLQDIEGPINDDSTFEMPDLAHGNNTSWRFQINVQVSNLNLFYIISVHFADHESIMEEEVFTDQGHLTSDPTAHRKYEFEQFTKKETWLHYVGDYGNTIIVPREKKITAA